MTVGTEHPYRIHADGQRLVRAFLEEEERSQAWLARRVGASRMNLSRWVGGKTTVPALEAAAITEIVTDGALDTRLVFDHINDDEKEDHQ